MKKKETNSCLFFPLVLQCLHVLFVSCILTAKVYSPKHSRISFRWLVVSLFFGKSIKNKNNKLHRVNDMESGRKRKIERKEEKNQNTHRKRCDAMHFIFFACFVCTLWINTIECMKHGTVFHHWIEWYVSFHISIMKLRHVYNSTISSHSLASCRSALFILTMFVCVCVSVCAWLQVLFCYSICSFVRFTHSHFHY